MTTDEPSSFAACGARILTHPLFDRPPVANPRRRGKMGAVSLWQVRNRKAAEQAAARQALRHLPPADLVSELREVAGASAEFGIDTPVIAAAVALLHLRLRQPGAVMDTSVRVRAYLALNLAELDRESFHVMFLDSQNALIAFEAFGVGTLAQTTVYPREIARRALALNAAAVILAHNHPSGNPEPSRMDEVLTLAIRHALSVFDVRVIDHVVVGRLQAVSMAERGML